MDSCIYSRQINVFAIKSTPLEKDINEIINELYPENEAKLNVNVINPSKFVYCTESCKIDETIEEIKKFIDEVSEISFIFTSVNGVEAFCLLKEKIIDENVYNTLTNAFENRTYVVGQKTANLILNKSCQPKLISKTSFKDLMEIMNNNDLLTSNKFIYWCGDKQAVSDEDLHYNIK